MQLWPNCSLGALISFVTSLLESLSYDNQRYPPCYKQSSVQIIGRYALRVILAHFYEVLFYCL